MLHKSAEQKHRSFQTLLEGRGKPGGESGTVAGAPGPSLHCVVVEAGLGFLRLALPSQPPPWMPFWGALYLPLSTVPGFPKLRFPVCRSKSHLDQLRCQGYDTSFLCLAHVCPA